MHVPLSIKSFLERGVNVFGHREAIVDEPDVAGSLGRLTYSDLGNLARGMAASLDEMGVGRGQRVAMISPNSAKFITSFFGTSSYGRVLVPINYRLSQDDIQYILDHCGVEVALIDPEVLERTGNLNVPHQIVLDGSDDLAFFSNPNEPQEWYPEDEQYPVSINYTSGTTSRPKGVVLTNRNCYLNAVTLGWHAAVTDRDVYLHTLLMFHCNGWGLPYAVTGMGCKQVVVRRIDGEEILNRIEAEGVTLLSGAPAVVSAILDAAEARRREGRPIPGEGIVRMIVAGAPPPTRTIELVETLLGWEFLQLYGLTETSPLVTFNRAPFEWDGLPPGDRAQRLSHAGPPGIGVQLRIDANGEVLTRSNNVFQEYWEDPQQTDAAQVEGWFHTGDGGYLEGASLVISDRKKDVIISGGENVSSIEVEDRLLQHAEVAEACVIGVPDPKWGETVKALVVLRDGATVSERDLIDFCRESLSHFKCPTSVEFRTELERTATGKLQKFKLRAPYWAGQERLVG